MHIIQQILVPCKKMLDTDSLCWYIILVMKKKLSASHLDGDAVRVNNANFRILAYLMQSG